MKYFLILLISFLFNSCASNKTVYWCGDHQCISKKEKEAYFKKNLIVEKRHIKKNDKKNLLASEKIITQAKLNEKKRIKNEKELAKQEKLKEKIKLKEEKLLIKREKLEKKRLKKDKKELAKKVKLEEKKIIKENKNTKKQQVIVSQNKTYPVLNIFDNLKDKILKRNNSKPYPDINDIQQ